MKNALLRKKLPGLRQIDEEASSASRDDILFNDHSCISIHLGSLEKLTGKKIPVGELLIIDPLKRRTGYDPIKDMRYEEIPYSLYDDDAIEDCETGEIDSIAMELEILAPIEGGYLLKVIGTGEGTYTLEIATWDSELNSSIEKLRDIPISPGVVHNYYFEFKKSVGSKLELFGGFDGKGQQPKDANKFLTYGNISNSTTILPKGSTNFGLLIFFNKTILPETFSAILNGVDISSSVVPKPGEHGILALNLKKGENTLVLSVEGYLGKQIVKDTDSLVFIGE